MLVVANEADGDTEVDVDTVAYLDTRAAVTSEEDRSVGMADVSIGLVKTQKKLLTEKHQLLLVESCMMPVLFKLCRGPRW